MEKWTSLFYIQRGSISFLHNALQFLNETFSDRWLGNGCLILMPPQMPNFIPSVFCCQVSNMHTKNHNSPHAIKTFIMHTHTHTWSSRVISFKCVKVMNIITRRSWKFIVTRLVSKWVTKSHSPIYNILWCQNVVKLFLQIILCYQFYTFQHFLLQSQFQLMAHNSPQQVQGARNLQLAKLNSSVYSHWHSSWNRGMKMALIHLLVIRTSKLNIHFAIKKKVSFNPFSY